MDAYTRAVAQQWLDDERPAEVVVVIEAHGSVPRGIGTRMVVSATEAVGTIGGGNLEHKAIIEARALLQSGSGARSVEYALGPSLGQCCGGTVTLGFTRLDERALAAWPEPEPLFHLQMYGAGHVGQAIARLLMTINCRVDWIDEREEQFPNALFDGAYWPAHIRTQCVDAIEDEVRHAPVNGCFLVLTHNHDLDFRITEAILRRGDFAYLGLIGSKTKRARFTHRFEQRGIARERIARMTCPIGLPGISGKEPEMIAIAAVAQLLLQREQTAGVAIDLFASPSAGYDQPFEMLRACHGRVNRSLALLGRLVDHVHAHGADAQAAAAASDVLRYFDSAAPNHHEDEERHVFPRLAQEPQFAVAVARLRAEHLEIDRLWQALRPQLEAVTNGSAAVDATALQSAAQPFIAIHDGHVATEDRLVFPAAETLVRRDGEQALAAIGNEMAQRRGVKR